MRLKLTLEVSDPKQDLAPLVMRYDTDNPSVVANGPLYWCEFELLQKIIKMIRKRKDRYYKRKPKEL